MGIDLFRLLTYIRIARKDEYFIISSSRVLNTKIYEYAELNTVSVYPASYRSIDLSSVRSSFSSPETFLASSPTLYLVILFSQLYTISFGQSSLHDPSSLRPSYSGFFAIIRYIGVNNPSFAPSTSASAALARLAAVLHSRQTNRVSKSSNHTQENFA